MDLLNPLALLGNFLVIPGVTYGCQLALGALGVTLIYGILRFSNFAHGETMAFGTMLTILATLGLQSAGVSLGPLPTALLAMPVGIAGTIILLLLTDRLVYRFYRRERSSPVILLIASLGVMFLYNGLIRFVVGPDDRNFTDGERFIFTAREFKQFTGLREGMAFKTTQGITIVVTVLIVILLFWFLTRTRTGKSAILATIAGTLYGLDKSFKPFTYLQLLLPIFAAAIVGGLGSPLGAIAGGFVIALSTG